jgi:hypothetical protein
MHRRRFLSSLAATGGLSLLHGLKGAEPPEVTDPRATSGDKLVEPRWEQRLTITVGNNRGDLRGDDHAVIQAAIDHLAALGGGTVRLLPGTWRLRNAVALRDRIRLVGSGDETILVKEPSVTTRLAQDSDWYDQEITLADAKGFELGDGVCLRAKNVDTGAAIVLKRTLVARRGRRFKLDRPLRENLWQSGDASCATLFPLLSGENVEDVVIEDVALDGNKEANDNLDGNHAGCIFLQDSARVAIRGVSARNYNGDGISWQICHDVRVEGCSSCDHAGLGLHPGSGSQRPIIRDNRLQRNDIGIFFCWGVKYGLAEENTLLENRCGISIGHRDTDNVIVKNEIRGSRECGLLYRAERGPGFAPHRNRVEENTLVDNGGETAAAIDMQGQSTGNVLARNQVRETRSPAKRIGLRISSQTKDLLLVDNQFAGFAKAVEDLRSA